ncbi:MAG: pyridoxamine 5'-phosphate oxidase family protein [Nitrospiraceae bacterium]|nr:pyridoxamine 5'-phosphate oxidase family protein [Nitrospiraceae bacterium]
MAMSEALSSEEVQAAWAKLTEEIRTGVLLTLRNGRPFGSHVPYVFGEHWTRAYIHVSRLALHTEHLLHDPRVGLFVSEPDQPGKNPLALRRMNLQGEASLLDVGVPDLYCSEGALSSPLPSIGHDVWFCRFRALGIAARRRTLGVRVWASLPCTCDGSPCLATSEAEYEDHEK